MKSQDRIKRVLHLLRSDGTIIDITTIPLRLELRRGVEIVKVFTNAAWDSSQDDTDESSPIQEVDSEHFLLTVDGDELDSFTTGTYTVHAYYFETDTDFSDGSCRRYAPFDGEIIIK